MYGDVAYHDISIQSVDRTPAVPCEIAMRLSSAKLEDMLRKKKEGENEGSDTWLATRWRTGEGEEETEG